MKSKILISLILITVIKLNAQNVAVTDDNGYSANTSAMLDVKSTDKGLLVPRVSLVATTSASPVTSPATSLIVYNIASVSDVTPGYYYWNGTKWIKIKTNSENIVTKDADATLIKTENFVLASNDITITLPSITADDNGLVITVKNIGTYTDLITVNTSGGATIDGFASVNLYLWQTKTFIAYSGNWVLEDFDVDKNNEFEVSSKGSWTTIPEILAFLDKHISAPSIIKLTEEVYNISETQLINFPFPVTIQGLSYGHTTIAASAGLANKPMFRCFSDCYFKMLMFDATTLASYGTQSGEDAIRYVGSDIYSEIKDCTFDSFNNTILDSTNAELWIFECDISNAVNSGIMLHSAIAGVKVRVAETDFINCKNSVNFSKGANAEIQLQTGSYLNANATDTAIIYNATNYTYSIMQITNNMFNGIGKFIKGFDFTRADGRDANVYIENNAGYETKRPHCKINVLNNVLTTTVVTAGTWVKANWVNTTTYNCKFAVSDNRITYLSSQVYDGIMTISGNVICNNDNKILSVALVKNGNIANRYGETTVKLPNSANPYQWSTNVYLEDMSQNDYYEIWISSSSNNDIYKLQDVLWFTNTQ